MWSCLSLCTSQLAVILNKRIPRPRLERLLHAGSLLLHTEDLLIRDLLIEDMPP